MNNIFVKDAIQAKELLKASINKTKNTKNALAILEADIAQAKDIEDDYKKYIKMKTKELPEYEISKLKLEANVLKLEKQLKTNRDKIDNIDLEIEQYMLHKSSLEYNNELNIRISHLRALEVEFGTKIKDYYTTLVSLQTRRDIFLKEKEEKEQLIDKMIKIENKLRVQRYYHEATHKNGVPYMLIMNAIPVLEDKINNMLELLTDFGIKFEMDKEDIIINTIRKDDSYWPVEVASGFEKFISNLAIRIALTQVSKTTRSNFIWIDEGFGNFDKDNIANLDGIFEYLKSQFKFILIVSHIDDLRDMVDDTIEINIEDGYSQINF